jgi:hypothetical protein
MSVLKDSTYNVKTSDALKSIKKLEGIIRITTNVGGHAVYGPMEAKRDVRYWTGSSIRLLSRLRRWRRIVLPTRQRAA